MKKIGLAVLLAPLWVIGFVALAMIGKVLYDAVVTSPTPWQVIGLIFFSFWLSVIILVGMSRG